MDDRTSPEQDPPALNATRQMLDELDALMERMLAVPVSDGEEESPAPSAIPQKSRPLAPTLTLLQVPPEEAPVEEPRPELPPLDPPHDRPNPSHLPIRAPRGNKAEDAAEFSATMAPSLLSNFSYRTPELPPLPGLPAAAPEAFSSRALPPLSSPSVDAVLDEVPEPIASPMDWLLLPIIWCNRLFDHGTRVFGDSGNWLRSPLGRMLLGAVGLILLAAAGAWASRDWLGWTW